VEEKQFTSSLNICPDQREGERADWFELRLVTLHIACLSGEGVEGAT
jgi:hypothetical protein